MMAACARMVHAEPTKEPVPVWDLAKDAFAATTGKIERVVHMPVERPSSCAFGGKNFDELYITSAATTITDEERAKQPWIGSVLRIFPGVKGLPEPEFGG